MFYFIVALVFYNGIELKNIESKGRRYAGSEIVINAIRPDMIAPMNRDS
jgi:hypothetical protein